MKAMKLEEHIDITGDVRATDNLGENGESTLRISAALSLQK